MSTVWTDISLPFYQACLWFAPSQSEYGFSSCLWATSVCHFTMDCIFQEWYTIWAQIIICAMNKTWANLQEKGDYPLEQVSQRSCGVTIFGDTQNLAWHSPEQPTLADLDLSKGLDQMVSQDLFPSQLCCETVQVKFQNAIEIIFSNF